MDTCRKKKMNSNGKRGFTLAEICVTLALVAVLGVMTVSFATMTGNLVSTNSADYRFLEQCDQVRQTLTNWIAVYDGTPDLQAVNGNLKDITNLLIAFSGETLTLTDGAIPKGELAGLTEVKAITFEMYSTKLIKCTVQSTNEKMKPQVFLFSLRSGDTATLPTTKPENGEG